MPLTAAAAAVGKIVGPLLCAAEVRLLGMGLVFYVLLFFTALVFFICIALHEHLRGLDWLPPPTPNIQKPPTDDDSPRAEDRSESHQPLLSSSPVK